MECLSCMENKQNLLNLLFDNFAMSLTTPRNFFSFTVKPPVLLIV